MRRLITALALAAGLTGILAAPSAARADIAPAPAVTCGGYGHLQDNSYGGYQIHSYGSNGTYVTLNPPNQTNFCKQYQIGAYYELVQYGTNLCLTYNAGQGIAYMNTCAGLVSQYWTISHYELITLYNYTCAHNYNNIFEILVSFGGGCDGWLFT